jgi:hypothetical protein
MQISEVHSEEKKERDTYEMTLLPDQEKYFPKIL